MISLTLLTSEIISQKITATDSVTFLPNGVLREAIKDIERGKICKEEIVILKNSITILNQRIDNQQTIITELKEKSSLQDTLIAVYIKNEKNYENILRSNNQTISIYRRKLTWHKALKWIYALGGFAAGIIIIK